LHRGQVDQPVLGPAGGHDQQPVTRLQPERREPPGQSGHPMPHLPPAQRRPGAVQGGERRKAAELLGIALQQERDGQSIDHAEHCKRRLTFW
jgi:hypothetical protein